MTDFARTNNRRKHDQQYRLRVDTDPDYIIPGLAELRIPAKLSATSSPAASSPSSPPSASSDSSRDSSATTSDDEVAGQDQDPALYRRRTTGECVAQERKNVKLRAKLSAIEGRKTNRSLMRFFGGGSRQRGAPIPVEITEQSVGGCAFEVGLDVPDVNAAVESREAFTL